MTDTFTWPRKTREIQARLGDARVWNEFQFRDDDIVITTWRKAGTTWMQQIAAKPSALFDRSGRVRLERWM